MRNPTPVAVFLPAPVAARVVARAAYWQSPEADPEGDCSAELAEAMALQEECEAMLRELAERVNATSNPATLRRLYRELYNVRHDVCHTCGMCAEELQGRKFCPDCP